MREAMTDRVADWRLLGLGFWQAWQIVAMCTDIVAPTSGKLFDQGNALLILLVLMTAAYLAVVVASRRYAPFAGRDSSYVLAAALMAAGTLAMPVALHFLEGIVGIGVFVMAAASASLGNALLLIMWGELWSALATGRVGRLLHVCVRAVFPDLLHAPTRSRDGHDVAADHLDGGALRLSPRAASRAVGGAS